VTAEYEPTAEQAWLRAGLKKKLDNAKGAYGRAIDEALAAFSEAANAYKRAVDELNSKLDVSAPSGRQLQSALNRVLRTVVVFTPARDAVEFIAPAERRTMVEVADGHAAAIARIAGPRLPTSEAAEEDAASRQVPT
jgi:hypothetical protein